VLDWESWLAGGGQKPLLAASPPSRRSLRALNWFVFFLADIQAGFGPFAAAYLATLSWSQGYIGLALTSGSLIALASQVPAGALVDAVPAKRLLAAIGVLGVCCAALILAIWPTFFAVISSEVIHAIASCILGPATVAISLGLVGYKKFSDRLALNVRYAALGNAIAAVLMGLIGYRWGAQAIFFVSAFLAVPAMIALSQIRTHEIDPASARGGVLKPRTGTIRALAELGTNRALLIFASAIVLFQLANAALLPFMASVLTSQHNHASTLFVAGMIVGPQLVASVSSKPLGRQIERRGRRPLLMLAFAPLPIRALVLAFSSDPYVLTLTQLLDGISAATLGILVPLVIADLTEGSGHFNLAQGFVATAVGIGAAISTTLTGYTMDFFGFRTGFLMLMVIGTAGFILVAMFMPETKRSGKT
jgi:MFS family permease